MAKYNYEALKALWIANGGNPAAAGIAAAVALAESGGNSDAISPPNSNGTLDRGLWQINSIHGAKSTTDINANAKAAIAISSNGTNWNPWTVFKSGAYKKYLGSGDPTVVGTASVDIQPTSDPNPLTGIASGIVTAANAFSDAVRAGTWLSKPHNQTRIFMVVIGGGLILTGVVILARGTIEDAAQAISTKVKSAASAAAKVA